MLVDFSLVRSSHMAILWFTVRQSPQAFMTKTMMTEGAGDLGHFFFHYRSLSTLGFVIGLLKGKKLFPNSVFIVTPACIIQEIRLIAMENGKEKTMLIFRLILDCVVF